MKREDERRSLLAKDGKGTELQHIYDCAHIFARELHAYKLYPVATAS